MTAQHTPIRFGFLLVPDYTMLALSNAIEPLRMANQLSEQPLYEWFIITRDGNPIVASSGVTIQPDFALADCPRLDILFVCSGVQVKHTFNRSLKIDLTQQAKRGVPLGSLCTGSYLLAKCGLLSGYRCTIHWENLASMREEFPSIQTTDELYEIDRDRYTCAGGSAPMDMMLKLIRNNHGQALSTNISEQFLCERIRGHNDRQRIPLQLQLGTNQTKLTEAVTLMEANIEEPISLEELSNYVGVSRRHLERLFQKYLHCVPTRYYKELRLKKARQLLIQTDKPIIDVALACGFVSAPHFSKCYRDYYDTSPRDDRQLKTDERLSMP